MSNPTIPPTIAELWREFSIYDHLDHFYNPETYAGSDSDREYFEGQLAKREALRVELLERCKRVDESDGYYTTFKIDEYVIATHFKPNGQPKHVREDAADTAREMGAAYAFLAWELEQQQRQREKEAAQ